MKRVTIKDIASRLGLSVSTVSRALSGDALVRSETRETVEKVAEELGYRRNPVAANLRSGNDFVIGLVVPGAMTPVAAEIYRGVQSILHKAGYTTVVASSDESSDRELKSLKKFSKMRADGLLVSVVDGKTNVKELLSLENEGTQIVFYDRMPLELTDRGFSYVGADDENKSFYLVEHMIMAGRRRILHLSGARSIEKCNAVYTGYKGALMKYGLPIDKDLILEVSNTVESGYEAADMLLNSGVEFDGVFGCGDMPAIGFMNRLQERGIKVPEQVSVAAYYGTGLSHLVYPSLTTVETNLEMMGRCAAELLLEQLKNPDIKRQRINVDASIKLRTSTHPDRACTDAVG